MSHVLPPMVPRSGGPISRALGRAALRLLGWKIVGEFPNLPKMVAIVAPHTSNWDFVVGLAGKFTLGLNARWLGKHTIFRGPGGRIFRSIGGIPVDRSSSHNVVASSVRAFSESDAMVLVIAPSGTRRSVAEWRTGFWRIADAANVPILILAFDWKTREIRIGPTVMTEGTVEEQLPRIRALFSGAAGLRRAEG
jgi:1-acyl-sn-glycerol-3-phosphate acyltransferase